MQGQRSNAGRVRHYSLPGRQRLLTQAVGMAAAIKLPCHAVFGTSTHANICRFCGERPIVLAPEPVEWIARLTPFQP
jgi:hypothetical protein